MVNTARLRNSMTFSVIDKPKTIGVIVGTNVGYAAPHQDGVNKKVKVKAFKRKGKIGKRWIKNG